MLFQDSNAFFFSQKSEDHGNLRSKADGNSVYLSQLQCASSRKWRSSYLAVINLGRERGSDRAQLVKQILQASQEFGFFQLVNHGISEKLMHDVWDVANEFFKLPAKDKASLYSEDFKQRCRVYTSIDYGREKVHYWKDSLRHPCHPVEEHAHLWPEKPSPYREVMGSYAPEVRKQSLWLLDIIWEGLGLTPGYFRDELSQVQVITHVHHYPPCPDPSLTLGSPKHVDPYLLTFLLQGEVKGLQVLKDGQWLAVEPLPNALVVNIGYTLQILSNGKLRSAEHRVVTHRDISRTTVCIFIHPSDDCQIGPVKELLSDCNPPLYRDIAYGDFFSTYVQDTQQRVPPLERYKILH